MNGNQFVRRAALRAKARELAIKVDASRGKGGHQIIRIGENWTTVQTGESRPGIFYATLKQLGIPKDEFRVMQTWAIPAVIEKLADDDFLATFPDVPEAMTGGASLAEVRENAADALEEAILAYLALGRPIPAPRAPLDGEEPVILDPVAAARAALATVMREKKISIVALAKTLGKSEGAIRRLTDGSRAVKIDTVLAAMNALGARAILGVLTA